MRTCGDSAMVVHFCLQIKFLSAGIGTSRPPLCRLLPLASNEGMQVDEKENGDCIDVDVKCLPAKHIS